MCALTIMALLGQSAGALAQASADKPPKPQGYKSAPSGTGPYPAIAEVRPDIFADTLYRPAALPATGRLPVILWGNGACRDNGLQHAMFLREVASHGYVIIALGRAREERGVTPSTPTPPPGPQVRATADETTLQQMMLALDWAEAVDKRGGDPLAGHLDLSRVGVMGHSCGGLQAIAMSADSRIKATAIFNSGVYNDPDMGGRSGIKVGKSALDALHAPIAYFLGGAEDIAYANGMDDVSRITKVPVFNGNLPVGHSGTFWLDENGGDWARVATGWFGWHLKGDKAAARLFSGADCTLCRDPRWTIVRKGMK